MTTQHARGGTGGLEPHHLFGEVVEKEGAHLVFWTEDGSVEPAWPGSARDERIMELQSDVRSIYVRGIRHPARIIEALGSMGYRHVGSRRFSFVSGDLYRQARSLSVLCRAAGDEMLGITSRRGESQAADPRDRARWVEVGHRMNACAMGSRLLGLAAVETLVNEVMAVRFPKEFNALENFVRKPGLAVKLRRFCQLVELEPEPDWVSRLEKEDWVRRPALDHHPAYQDDLHRSIAVDPFDTGRPEETERFLDLVDEVFDSVFDAFGVSVPPTHRP